MPAKKRLIKAEDLYRMQVLSNVRISPDGEWVVYTLQRVEKKTEKKFSNLWVAPTRGGAPFQFTQGDQSDTSPRWSPDGSQIAFLSNRGKPDAPPQLYVIPFRGGEAKRLTQIEGEILSFDWSPDGRSFLCTIRKKDKEVLEREKDETRKKLGPVSRFYDRVFYKLDGYGYLPYERTHLWLVNARTGRARQLTDSDV